MNNVYIYCEGPTEESFINEVLYPYFLNKGIYVYPIICTTKRTISRKYKGGVSSYAKIKKELSLLSLHHQNEFVTTMFDYYGMPNDTPNINCNTVNAFDRIKEIEKSINEDIDKSNCSFHFMLHEFEAILFSDPDSFKIIADDTIVEQIQEIKSSFSSPELINNSPETAPSKRLEALIPYYSKIKNGTLLSKVIGIDQIMFQCPHFKEWIQSINSRFNS